MKNYVLFMVLVSLLGTTVACGGGGDGQLHGTLDLTYVSRYIWRGYDAYANNHSAFQPSLDLDLFGTGFGFTTWWSRANGSGFEKSEWLTFTPYYRNRLFADTSYVTNYKIGYTYFAYPDAQRRGANPGTGHAQEVFGMFQWPKLLPGGLVPSYAVFAYWPSEHSALNRNNGGWAHVFGLNYDIMIPALLSDGPDQPVHLGFHTVYNDSVGPAGRLADHDWSHGVFSISTDFQPSDNVRITPGFHYQSSWDDSINTSDEYWTSLSLAYSF
ncbi:MAG: hypothetical protein JW720_03865 [Sedimentisphaerales bacterium]|nr:hypothetical protein [Sedimentisphaerales bacterium]